MATHGNGRSIAPAMADSNEGDTMSAVVTIAAVNGTSSGPYTVWCTCEYWHVTRLIADRGEARDIARAHWQTEHDGELACIADTTIGDDTQENNWEMPKNADRSIEACGIADGIAWRRGTPIRGIASYSAVRATAIRASRVYSWHGLAVGEARETAYASYTYGFTLGARLSEGLPAWVEGERKENADGLGATVGR